MAEMSQVIATRDLVRVRTDGVRETFTVEVGLPFLAPTGKQVHPQMPYQCTMRILGVQKSPTVYVYHGQNSMEALQGAMSAAGVILSGMPFSEEFVESTVPNMGFAVLPFAAAMGELQLTDRQKLMIRHIKGEIDIRESPEAAAFFPAKPE